MTKLKIYFITLFSLDMLVLSLAGCKLDPPIYPQVTAPNTGSTTPVAIDTANNLFVSTLTSGGVLQAPTRVCSNVKGTLFATSFEAGIVYKVTPSGLTMVLATNLQTPYGIKAAINGDVYVALASQNKIVKIDNAGIVSNVAIGLPLNYPQDIAMADDNTLYIADTGNNRILKVAPDGITTILAGTTGASGLQDGNGPGARFSSPTSIKLAEDGFLWVVDGNSAGSKGKTIRRITLSGTVKTIFKQITPATILDIAVAKRDIKFAPSNAENLFLVYDDNTLSYLTTTGTETKLSGNTAAGATNGKLSHAQFSSPGGISIHESIIYIADKGNNALRRIARK